jgi:hypothetical protein
MTPCGPGVDFVSHPTRETVVILLEAIDALSESHIAILRLGCAPTGRTVLQGIQCLVPIAEGRTSARCPQDVTKRHRIHTSTLALGMKPRDPVLYGNGPPIGPIPTATPTLARNASGLGDFTLFQRHLPIPFPRPKCERRASLDSIHPHPFSKREMEIILLSVFADPPLHKRETKKVFFFFFFPLLLSLCQTHPPNPHPYALYSLVTGCIYSVN